MAVYEAPLVAGTENVAFEQASEVIVAPSGSMEAFSLHEMVPSRANLKSILENFIGKCVKIIS